MKHIIDAYAILEKNNGRVKIDGAGITELEIDEIRARAWTVSREFPQHKAHIFMRMDDILWLTIRFRDKEFNAYEHFNKVIFCDKVRVLHAELKPILMSPDVFEEELRGELESIELEEQMEASTQQAGYVSPFKALRV